MIAEIMTKWILPGHWKTLQQKTISYEKLSGYTVVKFQYQSILTDVRDNLWSIGLKLLWELKVYLPLKGYLFRLLHYFIPHTIVYYIGKNKGITICTKAPGYKLSLKWYKVTAVYYQGKWSNTTVCIKNKGV